MPHFVIEYSTSGPAIDFAELLPRLGQVAAATGIMKLEDIKLRALAYDTMLLNDGSRSFLHLTVSLLAGRTPDRKEALAIACRKTLVDYCPQIDAISVDIRDMDPTAYKKRVRLGREQP